MSPTQACQRINTSILPRLDIMKVHKAIIQPAKGAFTYLVISIRFVQKAISRFMSSCEGTFTYTTFLS